MFISLLRDCTTLQAHFSCNFRLLITLTLKKYTRAVVPKSYALKKVASLRKNARPRFDLRVAGARTQQQAAAAALSRCCLDCMRLRREVEVGTQKGRNKSETLATENEKRDRKTI